MRRGNIRLRRRLDTLEPYEFLGELNRLPEITENVLEVFDGNHRYVMLLTLIPYFIPVLNKLAYMLDCAILEKKIRRWRAGA